MTEGSTESHQRGERGTALGELARVPVLREVPPEELRRLAARGVRHTVQGGAVIESPLEDGQICVVLEGKVRVLLVSTDGRELAIAERVAGDLVEVVTGCQEAYCPGERIAVAGQEGARVFFLPAHEFLCAVTVTQEGALHLVEALQDATRGRDRVIGELAFCSVRARVARVVSRLARESDGCLVRETHQEIAVRAGTGREEVSRVLASFRRQNLLEPTGRGQIRVLQPERLVDETSSPV